MVGASGVDLVYVYIIYTPNLGSGITVFVREREQGRSRGSIEGARGRSKGAPGEYGGARGSSEGAKIQPSYVRRGAVQWEPNLAA